MASRSNTALHAAVILLILLVVVLGVTTYVFWSKQDQFYREKTSAENAAEGFRKAKDDATNAYELVKVVVGRQKYNTAELEDTRKRLETSDPALYAEVKAIDDQFQKDMQSFPSDYVDTKDYTTLHVKLFQMLKDVNAQLADANARANQADDNVKTVTTNEQAKTKAAEEARSQAVTEKTNAETMLNGQMTKLQQQNDLLVKQLADAGKDYKAETDKLEKEKKSLAAEVALLQQKVDEQADKLASMTRTSFVHADGRIVHVSQEQRRVWIDLGSKDGLQRQQTFSIYDQNEVDFEHAKPKGTIEVTAITGPSMAEARIVTDDVGDPLLTGDVVFTPVWQPGQRLHFALAGLLDINGDHKTDADRVKALIGHNGGIIDAEVTEVGARTGKITVETRYLVVGERPTDTSDPTALKAYSDLIKEAETYGIEKISVDKLLSMMGYRPETITTPLGGSAPGGGFRERRPADAYNP